MPRAAQVRFVRESLRALVETLYTKREITRPTLLSYQGLLRRPSEIEQLTACLYGSKREVLIPGERGEPDRKLILLPLREIGTRRFNLLVFKLAEDARPKKDAIRCLVGHRFTRQILGAFRWNLRNLFDLFGIKEDYSDFDGAAVNIIDDLCDKIRDYDFCLFDNRETTNPSKPNVYIEAGMAFALRKPFVFCHYRKEVWPSDFSNILYIPYRNYKDLFQTLYARMPIFLKNRLKSNP